MTGQVIVFRLVFGNRQKAKDIEEQPQANLDVFGVRAVIGRAGTAIKIIM